MNSTSSSSLKTAELTGLSNSLFKKNRMNYLKNLLTKHNTLEKQSVIVLEGGKGIPRYDTDVQTFHFIQDSHFYYLTGVREPDFYAVLDISKQELHLFYQLPEESTKVWQKVPSLEELTKKYEIQVYHMNELYDRLNSYNPKKIYLLKGTNSDSSLEVKTAHLIFPEKYKDLEKIIDTDPLIYEYLADTKTRKNDEEVQAMVFSTNITIESHVNIMRNIKNFKNERDIEAHFLGYLAENYYTREFAYPCICGSSKDASTLHYVNNDKPLKQGSLVLIDMGSRFVGYCADITSTIPINGVFSTKQKQIYDLVLLSNRTVMKELKPGVSWPDMHILAENVILKGLIDIGLINNVDSIEEMSKNRVAYYFMPHGLGHLLGTDVHDAGGYLSFTPERRKEIGLKSLRTARTLEENMVVTVEPGIYFIQFLLEKAFADEKISKYFNVDALKEYYDFGGVRIEDDVLITKDSCVNLSQNLPRTTEEIEFYMK
jgi:Xaa-Pro dipeptidase